MKLKDLNKLIKEGEYSLYNIDTDKEIVYDNDTRKEYENYNVKELYPVLHVYASVVIEITKEDVK